MKKIAACVLVAVGFVLSACKAGNTPEGSPSPAPSLPSYAIVPGVPEEDLSERTDVPVVISHYPLGQEAFQGDGALVSNMAYIDAFGGQTTAEAVLEALLSGAFDKPNLSTLLPVGTTLRSLKVARNIAIVDLFVPMGALDATNSWELYAARQVIANNLCALGDVQYVNVLFNGLEPGYLTRPSGLYAYQSGKIAVQINLLREELTQLNSDTPPEYFTRDVVLYFVAPEGGYLLPEVRRVQFSTPGIDRMGIAEQLLDELRKGPASGSALQPVLPAQIDYALPPGLAVQEGEVVMVINAKQRTGSQILYGGLDDTLAMAAITLTLTSNYPSLQYVQFQVDSLPVNGVGSLTFENSWMMRSHFEAMIGKEVPLYFSNAEHNALIRAPRTVAADEMVLPRTLLEHLLDGPRLDQTAQYGVFPFGVQSTDILSASQIGESVFVNFSRKMPLLCEGMTLEEERMMVYAMVSTLLELPQAKEVWFYVEGKQVDALAGHLYMRGAFMKSPGLLLS